ncbi:hypothetical protein GMD78_05130 [Ornithinibacillus sp. L9]|uniref:Lipoprotein n=1 Tax=Ornithinibacillus caprae TaxID=2678566 RepID=A0A6N8FHQ2_9BACI|nr:hypothetical protein [Ornithinibacillus caprae]MUK87784.1 hypothetical protein [Ornithinibacillus caprae]
MNKYYKLAMIILFSGLLLIGCGSDDDAAEPNQGDSYPVNNKDESDSNAENDSESDVSGSKVTEIHTLEEEDDITRENISINYDGSVVYFDLVDDSGEDETNTPYFYYNGDMFDASSVDSFSDCKYNVNAADTIYFTGTCKDEKDTRVSVVYDITENTITHSTDRDRNVHVLNDGRVLYTTEFSEDGTIYELTEDGEEPFIEIEDMPTILNFSVDQNNEVFFIYGANDEYWNSYVFDTTSDSEPVPFQSVPDDDEATTVEGRISPDGKYIMYRYRGVTGGKHYNYVDSYIYNRDSEEEIHLGHGFDMNFVRSNGFVFDEVREYGQVIYNMETDTWLAPDTADITYFDSTYKDEYLDEADQEDFQRSSFVAISGDGETVLTLDRFRPLSEDRVEYSKLHTISTEDYIKFLEEYDIEIDFEPSPFDEKGA